MELTNTYKLLILCLGIWIGYDLKWFLIKKFYIKTDSITMALWNGLVNHARNVNFGKSEPIFVKGNLKAILSSDIESENTKIQTFSGEIKEKTSYSFDKEFCDTLIDNLPGLELFLKRKKSLGFIINKAYDAKIVEDHYLDKFIQCMVALRENKTETDYILEIFKERRKEKCNSHKQG